MFRNYWQAGFENAENVDNSEEFFRTMGIDELKGRFCEPLYSNFRQCKHVYFHVLPFSKRM